MTVLEIQHPVADFEGWKKAFDGDPMGRAKNGVIRHAIYRPADNPNYVIVILAFASREQADEFLVSLRGMWQRVGDKIGFGGMEGVQASILDEVEWVTY